VGNRDFPERRLLDVGRFVGCLIPGTLVVSGGAEGVDRTAIDAAEWFDYPWHEELPDKTRPSPQRYFERNKRIVEFVGERGGVIVAFSRSGNGHQPEGGTLNTCNQAERAGLPLIKILWTGREWYSIIFNDFAKHYRTPESMMPAGLIPV
jgi:hypothetical protein